MEVRDRVLVQLSGGRRTKLIILLVVLVITGGVIIAVSLLRLDRSSRIEQESWQRGRILTVRPDSQGYKSSSDKSLRKDNILNEKRGNIEQKKLGLVVIDPGHQEKANLEFEPIAPGASQQKAKVAGGASGVISGIPEHQLVLQLSTKLEKRLIESGVEVILTRRTSSVDISNRARAEIANRVKADLFIRIHANGSPNSFEKGIATLYPAKTRWTSSIYLLSQKAALVVQSELIKATRAKNRGITERKDITGFNWSKVPVVLVEVGFLTNPEEDRRLNEAAYQAKIVEGLRKGILRYLKSAKNL
jgi:N-acetylmuramoyl-L-alanine amidase